LKQKRLEKIADTVTRSESRNSALARLNGFWEVFSKDDNVLVVINADPDALAAAMAVNGCSVTGCRTSPSPNEISGLATWRWSSS
jgi:hypothetical protein